MKTTLTRQGIVSMLGLLIVAVSIAALVAPHGALAQQNTGSITARTQGVSPGLKGYVMMSIVQDGHVVAQTEKEVGGLHIFEKLPVGLYTVRFEGGGMTTLSKEGVSVNPGRDTSVVGPMREGQGVCECHYSK